MRRTGLDGSSSAPQLEDPTIEVRLRHVSSRSTIAVVFGHRPVNGITYQDRQRSRPVLNLEVRSCIGREKHPLRLDPFKIVLSLTGLKTVD